MSFQIICTATNKKIYNTKEILKCPYCNKTLINIGFALICQ